MVYIFIMRKWFLQLLILASMLGLTSCVTMVAGWFDSIRTGTGQTLSKTPVKGSAEGELRQVKSKEEFFGEINSDVIVLEEEDAQSFYTDFNAPQSRHVPGSKNSPVPSIASFHNPTRDQLTIFKKIYFETDKYVPKLKENYLTVHRIAAFLKKHSKTSLFIEGHCDERASEAYNLALGTRRANHVRTLLIKEGIPSKQIYTISYGKERPEANGHNENSWAKNRRVTFKLYEEN
ncbi:MAG: hypothetical protein A3F09_02135 [Chlamydiae bacterium RIFCSPHIGHO2_12_FULL_49_11]|nr:MAG: hypothetical protein A3F09_02135 [Chlamydiae bacterium RIFCSPHIGHO2_12_FULL_49_11]